MKYGYSLLLVFTLLPIYAQADWVVPTDRVVNGVTIRAQSNSGSQNLGQLRPNERLEWVQNVPRWREVLLSNGNHAFVTKSYTRVIEDPSTPSNDDMVIHFLNSGTGACAVVECPGTNAPPMVVD